MKPGEPSKFEAKQPNVHKRKIPFQSLAVAVLGLLFALALSVSLTAAQEAPASEEAPSFNGVWERNPDESDDPREKMQEALGGNSGQMVRGGGEGGRSGGGRPPGGRGGPSGMTGRGGRRGGSEKMQAMRETMKEAMQAAQTLEISLSETELRVVDGSDNVRIYYLDGKKHKRQTPGGVDLETVAQKRGDQITIEEKADSTKFTRTFALAPDGRVMVVTVRLENDRFKQPVVIRSVYDPLRDSETF